MALIFLDNFTDSNGTNLGSHTPDTGTGWTNHSTLNPGAVGAIQSNRHYGGVTNAHWYIDDTVGSADYLVTAETFKQPFGGNILGAYIYARFDTSANTGYWFRQYESGSNGLLQLGKTVSGTNTSLGTLSASYGTNTSLRLELQVEGTTITAWAQRLSDSQWILSDGSTTGTKTACFIVTDSSISAEGRAGLNATNSLSSTRTHFNWFQVDSLSNEFTESVSSTMSLTGGVNELEEGVSSTLDFGTLVFEFNFEDDREVPENVLAFTQDVQVEGLIQLSTSNLGLTQEATVSILAEEYAVESNLGLSQEVDVVFGVPHSAPWGVAGISQSLGIASNISISPLLNPSSTMALTQEAIASYGFESEITFVQEVSGGIGYEIEQDLGIAQVISRSGSEWTRSATSSMVLTSAGNGFDENDKCGRRYGRGGGPTSTGQLTLFSKDGLYSVTLRNPETDNTRRSAFDRVVRETRGGNLIVYRDDSWNTVQTLLFTIVAMKRSMITDLQTFFLNTLGEQIRLVDWLGEEWDGIVTRPDEIFTEDREGYWTFAFEFEGTKSSAKSGAQNLSLTSTATATVV